MKIAITGANSSVGFILLRHLAGDPDTHVIACVRSARAAAALQMAAFGFVQHNFFILFNALIGVVFLRRAQRELFGR